MDKNKLSDEGLARLYHEATGQTLRERDKALAFAFGRAVENAAAPSASAQQAEPVAYVGWGGEGKPKTLLLKADLPVGTSLYAKPVAQQAEVVSVQRQDTIHFQHPEYGPGIFFTEDAIIAADESAEEPSECPECHGVGRVEVTHEPLRDGYTETIRECCDTCQGAGKLAAPAPSASPAPVVLYGGGETPVSFEDDAAPGASPAALTVPAAITEWHAAWQAHNDAVTAYNARVAFARANEGKNIGSIHCDVEYRLMSDAKNKVFALLPALFEGIGSLFAASPADQVTSAARELVSQIEKAAPVDDHGHLLCMNAAFIKLKEML